MREAITHAAPVALAIFLGWMPQACTSTGGGKDESGPAPVDTATTPDTSSATPPIAPPSPAAGETTQARDTPPSRPSGGTGKGAQVSQAEYEGWRQYSVNCARCHGQDALPNPVAANLLISLGPGGPINTPASFRQVVSEGRPDRGMPAFKGTVSPEQIDAMYAYVKGRADKKIPPGRPAEPSS